MPGYHAVLSPSGASRWMKCTPSARFEQQFAEVDNEFTKEGTLAHSLAELFIKRKLARIPKKEYDKKLAAVLANDLYKPEMKAYCDNYATYVIEKWNSYGEQARLYTESEVDTSDYVEEGSGTVDTSIMAVIEKLLHIVDFKYGKGVPVDAEMNEQMLCYALGAYKKFSLLYEIDTIRMTIYQPRLDNIDTFEISIGKLMAWAETSLRPAAEKAWKGEGEFIPGGHCRFCKGRAQCKALKDYANEVAAGVFDTEYVKGIIGKDALPLVNKMDPEETVKVLLAIKTVESWFKAVKEYALSQALNNKVKWPGMKIVEGRSDRIITQVEKVMEALRAAGYKDDDFLSPRELYGVTKLTANMGTEDFNRIVDKFIIKPKGSPTLVSVHDKKPEMNSNDEAVKVFEKIDLEKLGIIQE